MTKALEPQKLLFGEENQEEKLTTNKYGNKPKLNFIIPNYLIEKFVFKTLVLFISSHQKGYDYPN
jgi:hypothetical protein